MILQNVLTEAELEILAPRQTALSELWQQDYYGSGYTWFNAMPDLAKAIAGMVRWHSQFMDAYSRAEMYVHRIMSRNMQTKHCTRPGDTFPMEIGRMTEDYSGIFPLTHSVGGYYIVFQDPYYRRWILMVWCPLFGVGTVFEVWEVRHGEEAIMFLSPEDTEGNWGF